MNIVSGVWGTSRETVGPPGPRSTPKFRTCLVPVLCNKNLAIANRSRVSCTQYVEGIHRPKYYTVTLKSRLKVTQGHWKRNHWTDHTRLIVECKDVGSTV